MAIRIPSGARLVTAAAPAGGGNPGAVTIGGWFNFDLTGDGDIFRSSSFEGTQPIKMSRSGSNIVFESRDSDAAGPTVSVPITAGWAYYAARCSNASGTLDGFVGGSKTIGGSQTGYLSAYNTYWLECSGTGSVDVWKLGVWTSALSDAEIAAKSASRTPEASPLPYNFLGLNLQTTGNVSNGQSGLADTGSGADATLTIVSGTPTWNTAAPLTITPSKWNTEPFQTFSGTLKVGVVAPSNATVDFLVNGAGGSTTSSRAYNSDTKTFDFFRTLTASAYSDGPITVDATVNVAGQVSTVLPQITLNANSGASLVETVYYVNGTTGSDSNTGGANDPYLTLLGAYQGAYDDLTGVMDGVVLEVQAAGNYTYGSVNHNNYVNANTNRPVTVRPSSSLSRGDVVINAKGQNVFSDTQGFNTSIIKFENMKLTVAVQNRTGYTSNLILKNCVELGSDREVSDFTHADFTNFYSINSVVSTAKRAVQAATLARGCRLDTIGESSYHDCPGAVVNCGVVDNDNLGNGDLHPDVYQFTTDPGNAVCYGLIARQNAAFDVRIQPSGTGIHIEHFNSDCTAVYSIEFERPYIDIALNNFVTPATFNYDTGAGFTASNLAMINVVVNAVPPAAHTGVTITTPNKPGLTVTPSGGSALDWFETHDLGDTPSGTALAKSFTVANPGAATLTIGEVELIDPDTGLASEDWEVTADPTGTIAASGSATLTIQLKDTAAAGDHAVRVIAYNNAWGFFEFDATATVSSSRPRGGRINRTGRPYR